MSKWVWTDERVAEMRRLRQLGLSFAQVADQLGTTKNACMGKASRLGIRFDAPAAPSKVTLSRAEHKLRRNASRAERAVAVRAVKEARERAFNPKPEPTPMRAKPVLLTGQEKVWTERKTGQCAYPVAGEGAETLSCCAPVKRGSSYCSGHRRLMFVKPEPKPPRERSDPPPRKFSDWAA